MVASRLGGLSAWRFAGNEDIRLDFFWTEEVATTCLAECQDNPDCVAFDETADGECTLFDERLFSLEANLMPFFDAEVFLTRCYRPEPLCDPATREVRRVNPFRRDDGDPHWMARESDIRDFYITDTPASHVLTAAINACRLQQHSSYVGGCIGFAIEDSPWGEGEHKVTLLYDFVSSNQHRAYRGDLADDPRVYNIEACL
eukprot:jgi/Ulvmu1/34/UM001_0036.1